MNGETARILGIVLHRGKSSENDQNQADVCDRHPGISPVRLSGAASSQSVLFTVNSRTNLLPSPRNKTSKQLLLGPDGVGEEEEDPVSPAAD